MFNNLLKSPGLWMATTLVTVALIVSAMSYMEWQRTKALRRTIVELEMELDAHRAAHGVPYELRTNATAYKPVGNVEAELAAHRSAHGLTNYADRTNPSAYKPVKARP